MPAFAAQAFAFGEERIRHVIPAAVLGVNVEVAVGGGDDPRVVSRLLPAINRRDRGLLHRLIGFENGHRLVEDHPCLAPALETHEGLCQPEFQCGVVACYLSECLKFAFNAGDDAFDLVNERLAFRALLLQQVTPLLPSIELGLLVFEQSLPRPQAIQAGDRGVVFVVRQQLRTEREGEQLEGHDLR